MTFSLLETDIASDVAKELAGRAWGPWSVKGNCLVYAATTEPNFEYDLDIATLQTPGDAARTQARIAEKSWVTEQTSRLLSQACEVICDAVRVRLRADLCDDDSDDRDDDVTPRRISKLQYYEHVKEKWSQFLRTSDPRDESAFQRFLEEYPCLLPDPFSHFHGGHHPPHLGGVIAQPELPGFRSKRPDFMLIAIDSATVMPILIEIEAPDKRWATNMALPTAEFTQAVNQLTQWKAWFAEAENRLQFARLYKLSDSLMKRRQLSPRYVLIYGRREESNRLESFAKGRQRDHEEYMTYDRLGPSGLDLVTIKLDRSGSENEMRLAAVQPTFHIHQFNSLSLSRMKGREEAIQRCALISPERQRYLIEQLAHCDNYAKRRLAEDEYDYEADGAC